MTPKRFHYAFIGGLTLFCLVGVVVGYAFFLGVLHASDNLIIANNSDDQLENRITALQKLQNSLQSVNEPLAALNEAIPKQQDIPGLITNLESAADATGVSITDLDFSAAAAAAAATAPTAGATPATSSTSSKSATPATPATTTPAKPAGATQIPFKMEVLGSYSQMTNFIDRLNRLPRYVDFSQLSLTKPHKELDSVDITFEANAYAQ
jgi:Tfp pilus assembly protein PilO